jgi:hypothetical protein
MGVIVGYSWFDLVRFYLIIIFLAGTAESVKSITYSLVVGYPTGFA